MIEHTLDSWESGEHEAEIVDESGHPDTVDWDGEGDPVTEGDNEGTAASSDESNGNSEGSEARHGLSVLIPPVLGLLEDTKVASTDGTGGEEVAAEKGVLFGEIDVGGGGSVDNLVEDDLSVRSRDGVDGSLDGAADGGSLNGRGGLGGFHVDGWGFEIGIREGDSRDDNSVSVFSAEEDRGFFSDLDVGESVGKFHASFKGLGVVEVSHVVSLGGATEGGGRFGEDGSAGDVHESSDISVEIDLGAVDTRVVGFDSDDSDDDGGGETGKS